MNYKEYQSLKQACELKIKVFSVAVYLATIFAAIQTAISFFKINIYFDPIYTYLLDVLYTMAQNGMGEGNRVISYIFYALYAAIIVLLIACSVMTFGTSRFAYGLVLAFYAIDALLCLLAASYYRFLVHLVLIILMVFAFRNQTFLNMLKSDTWGYQ
ncbi:MAG: hypothetical protein FWG30_03515 [Eubacteriaceae bacterium]|nr:hypothetical protein [Eubacteriaceae bacterium]